MLDPGQIRLRDAQASGQSALRDTLPFALKRDQLTDGPIAATNRPKILLHTLY